MKLEKACEVRPRTLVVLDWPNLKWSAHNNNYQIHPDKLFTFLREASGKNALICALTRINNTEKPQSDETIDSWVLERAGFATITTERPRGKDADVDAVLSLLVTWHIARNQALGNLVIVSGDGDYIPLIMLAKRNAAMHQEQIGVSVLAFRETLSTELKRAADYTYAIDQVPELVTKRERTYPSLHRQRSS